MPDTSQIMTLLYQVLLLPLLYIGTFVGAWFLVLFVIAKVKELLP